MNWMRCRKCVMPNTRPDTAFADGLCSACTSTADGAKIDWEARLVELKALLDRHDGQVIVPSSGGKDSTYQVVTLLELGATVTVVTAATCMLTEMGRKNIDNLARLATTVEITPNRTVRAKLNKHGLLMVGDISWPEHAAIFSIPFRMAWTLGVPLIMFGESPQRQYGGPVGSEHAKQMTLRWRSEFGGFLGMRPADFVGIEEITVDDMRMYDVPVESALLEAGVEAHFLGQYIPWDSRRNAEVAEAAGMQWMLPSQANWWTHENLDNAMTGLHDHMMYRKFGYGRLCAQVSVDVRTGLMKRADAMDLVRDRDGLFPINYMGVVVWDVLDRIGISAREFENTIHGYTNRELFDGEVAMRPILKEFA